MVVGGRHSVSIRAGLPACNVPGNCQFVANDSFTRAARPMLQQPYRLGRLHQYLDDLCSASRWRKRSAAFKQGKLDKAVLSRIPTSSLGSRWRATRSSIT